MECCYLVPYKYYYLLKNIGVISLLLTRKSKCLGIIQVMPPGGVDVVGI
jgi:hypothetical protein